MHSTSSLFPLRTTMSHSQLISSTARAQAGVVNSQHFNWPEATAEEQEVCFVGHSACLDRSLPLSTILKVEKSVFYSKSTVVWCKHHCLSPRRLTSATEEEELEKTEPAVTRQSLADVREAEQPEVADLDKEPREEQVQCPKGSALILKNWTDNAC